MKAAYSPTRNSFFGSRASALAFLRTGRFYREPGVRLAVQSDPQRKRRPWYIAEERPSDKTVDKEETNGTN